MIIVCKNTASQEKINELIAELEEQNLKVHCSNGTLSTILGIVGDTSKLDITALQANEIAEKVQRVSEPYKLVNRKFHTDDTVIDINGTKIGGGHFAVMAGPCSIETEEQIIECAKAVKAAGANFLRGGAFKPRTSPYSFQGLGEEGLKYLREAGDKYGMPVTTEVVSPRDVEMMKNYIDMFQIGARNMQNFELLKEVGKTGMPVLLKRGLCATIEEWLMAAEYLMANGTDQVVLCERGIRTFEKATRNTLDCSAIPVVQKLTHLPVIGDPSHATGIRDMVSPMALALVASGASGLMVEVHNHPEKALSDGPQSLYPSQFEKLVRDVQALCPVVGKSLETSPRIIPASITDESACETTVSENVIAFQGERGAFSELAIRRTFDEDVKVLPCKSFKETFDAVNTGKARYAVLPIENTLGGTILENIDLLGCYPSLTVVGEQQIRVIHNLIVNPGTKIEDIKKVLSHPQGLAQCQEFLSKELKNAEQVPFFDTAGSVSYIKQTGDKSLAAIAGAPAAAYNRMEILREGIETNPKNYTRFYILSREENSQEFKSRFTPNIASLLFNVSDESGALFKVLKILSDHGLNMKKLESRPIPGKPWEYSFFVEVEMKDNDEFNKTLTLLKEKTTSLRVLGTFRSAH